MAPRAHYKSATASVSRGRRANRRRFPAADPPRSGARSPARLLAWLHHRDVSRRRPQPSQARMEEDFGRSMTIFLVQPQFHSIYLYGIPRLPENPKTPLAKRRNPDSTERMIRPGFLDRESRQDLIELARNGSAAHRLARRANALVLLDDGMSCEAIAKVLLLDDDTIRTWYRLYEEDGIEGLTNFGYEGSACQLSGEQQEKLKAWVAAALCRRRRTISCATAGIRFAQHCENDGDGRAEHFL